MTRSSPRTNKAGECHRLNFFFDSDDGCALTTLVRGYRFHIICDAAQLKSQSDKGRHLENKYRQLISAVRKQEQDDAAEDDPVIHGMKEELEAEGVHDQPDSQDSGVGSSEPEDSDRDGDDHDSAVDVNENKQKKKRHVTFADTDGDLTEEEKHDPEKAVQNWMLAPFSDIFEDLEQPGEEEGEQQTLKEWYTGPTYFYQLEIKDDELVPVELESQPDLEKRISDMIPHIHVPKYIAEMDVPWIKADDLLVISESDEPDPYHPSRVKIGEEVYFLKLVDTSQPQPVKRELKLLKEIETKGLHEKFRVPLLQGLVGFENSKTETIGFLLTDIDDPTPLTKMLDSDVIEDKREKWAKESKRIVNILHENKIVWGDAKADNFMVDRHGDLWIIDFGGSYTDGWVDPELMETKEGDKMGIEKIVNALEDPEANTYEPGDEAEDDVEDKIQEEKISRKRSREDDVDEDQEQKSAKISKSSS